MVVSPDARGAAEPDARVDGRALPAPLATIPGPREGRHASTLFFRGSRRRLDELLSGDIGVAPLAMLARLPVGVSVEDGLAAVAQRLMQRVVKEAAGDRAKKLLTDALLLTGLRVRRDAAAKIFRGVRAMEESDTYLMIIDEGQEKHAKKTVLLVGTKRVGAPNDEVKTRLAAVTDLDRLDRMILQAITAASWQEILDTP